MKILTIYAPGELRKRHIQGKRSVAVLAGKDGKILLFRKEGGRWTIPEGTCERGETEEESARRVLGEYLFGAVCEVRKLCEFSVGNDAGTGKSPNKEERGGVCYLAELESLPESDASGCMAAEYLPHAVEMENPAMIAGLRRYAGEFFDHRLK